MLHYVGICLPCTNTARIATGLSGSMARQHKCNSVVLNNHCSTSLHLYPCFAFDRSPRTKQLAYYSTLVLSILLKQLSTRRARSHLHPHLTLLHQSPKALAPTLIHCTTHQFKFSVPACVSMCLSTIVLQALAVIPVNVHRLLGRCTSRAARGILSGSIVLFFVYL